MQSIINVAQYVYDRYKQETGDNLDEMNFAQRESLAITDEPLFKEEMQGWIHGPVSPLVRSLFSSDIGIMMNTDDVDPDTKRIVNNVISEFGHYASWKLRDLSHQELSWKNSRRGLLSKDRGSREISIDDIKEDSKKVRPFDYTWGMYYDEFEDYDGDLVNE